MENFIFCAVYKARYKKLVEKEMLVELWVTVICIPYTVILYLKNLMTDFYIIKNATTISLRLFLIVRKRTMTLKLTKPSQVLQL